MNEDVWGQFQKAGRVSSFSPHLADDTWISIYRARGPRENKWDFELCHKLNTPEGYLNGSNVLFHIAVLDRVTKGLKLKTLLKSCTPGVFFCVKILNERNRISYYFSPFYSFPSLEFMNLLKSFIVLFYSPKEEFYRIPNTM